MLAALAALALVSAVPPDTVGVETADSCNGDVACGKYAQGFPVDVTTYTGVEGAGSDVRVSREGNSLVFRSVRPLRAEAPCERVDDTTARCPLTEGYGGIPGLTIALGDLADAATVDGDLRLAMRLSGGAGDDTLTGGPGNEQIDGGPGSDVIQAGAGHDVLSYGGRTEPLVIDLGAGTGGAAGEHDVLGGFETVVAGEGDDRLRGGPAGELLAGGGGADRVEGRGGNDEVFGDEGSDRLAGGDGADRLFGDPEQGDDYYTPTFPWGDDVLHGGPGDDQLYDTGGTNVFRGGPGDDRLVGGVGPDRLSGGGGADILYGHEPGLIRVRVPDRLYGGAGDDRLDARDRLREDVICGAGDDRARTDPADRRRGCERRWRTRGT